MNTTFQLILSLLFVLSLSIPTGWSETIYLKSGEVLDGRMVSIQADAFSIAGKDGSTRKVSRKDLSKIDFAPIPNRQALQTTSTQEKDSKSKEPETFLAHLAKGNDRFQTPLHTFHTWRASAIAGDIKKMIECYAAFQQKRVKKHLKKYSKAQINEMREATAQTNFIPGQPFYQGDRAVLEVNWQKGLSGESQVLQFILEKNDWKIIQ